MSKPSPKRILLVEDEALIAIAETEMLRSCGYEVIVAATGQKAVELAGEGGIDLVLMDIDLGAGIDGTEAARRILTSRNLPIVFLSSHTEPEVVAKTEAISSYGYVTKSSGVTVLEASIKMAFRLFDAYHGLRDAEARYRSLYLHMSEGVALHQVLRDAAGRAYDYLILDTNDAFETQLGLCRENVIGKTSREAYGVEEPPYLDVYARVAETGKATAFETNFPEMDKHFSISVYCPGPGTFATVFQDITKRKEAEIRLGESEERFRGIVENSTAGYFLIDREGFYREVNGAWLGLHKYDRAEEVLGRHFSMTQVGGERLRADAVVRVMLEGGEPLSGEFSRLCQDGSIGWHSFTTSPVRKGGSVIGFEGFIIDRTETHETELALQASQEQLRLALRVAHAGIWTWDLKTNENRWSEELWALYSLEKESVEPCYESWIKTIVPEDREGAAARVNNASLEGSAFDSEWRVLTGDGSLRWLLSRGSPEKDQTGVVIRYIGVVIDITERKVAEERIRGLLARKELTLREVHHRIKNNMEAMSSFLLIQADMVDNPVASPILRDAVRRLRSMMLLYAQLYVSSEEGSLEAERYIAPLVDDILKGFPEHAAINVVMEIDRIVLDASRLQALGIIVNELISNVIKYAFPEGRQGTLALRARLQGGMVTFLIEDDGVGLPEGVDFGTTAGFGLRVVAGMAEQLRGRIRIEGGQGARYVLEFPLEMA